MGPMYFGASAYVPSEGMIIFGGAGNKLETFQKLKSLDGAWEQGPDFFESAADYFHCAVQVNVVLCISTSKRVMFFRQKRDKKMTKCKKMGNTQKGGLPALRCYS